MRFGSFRALDVPALVTVVGFLDFGVAPLACFVSGASPASGFGSDYAQFERALAYVVLGMGAFWVGCYTVSRQGEDAEGARAAAVAAIPSPPLGRAVICALALYSTAFLVKTYLLENFGFGYAASHEAYFKHLAAMQVAHVVSDVGTYALTILAIERSSHPSSLERAILFWVVFVPECLWGLLSGMKSELLQNFVLVAVASSMTERKLKRAWLVAALLGLVVIYPFSDQYRDLVRSRPDERMDLAAAGQISSQAFDRASAGHGLQGWLASGAEATMTRLNLLESVALVLDLGPRARLLQGDERWWMLPFYPFVPRLVWPGKPILDKGRRFSMALGYGNQTSTAITYPGDLVFEYGIAGLLAGMFLFGVCAQYLTNRFAVSCDKRRLFIYTGFFVTVLFGLELDAFDFWSTLIRNFAVLGCVGWLAYGTHRPTKRGGVLRGASANPCH
jgi:hypothetical protein